MRRREFISLLGGAAASWPLVARAQHSGKLPTIGFLGASTPSAWNEYVAAFVQRLRELGWTEGHTVAIEYRWAEGSRERIIEMAMEFAQRKVDVIFAPGTVSAVASKEATAAIPIVFTLVGDPVGTGLVASLARPGGNITGTSNQASELGSKRLELLQEIVPHARRLAILVNVENPSNLVESRAIQSAAQTLGLAVTTLEIRQAADIARSFESLGGGADALYVVNDTLIFTNLTRINTLVLAVRLPTVHGTREYVAAGGLMSYGPNYPHLFRRAAEHVDKVLRGTRPADIPVELPTKFDLVINMITAKALGLKVSDSFLLRADEVIE